MMTPNYIVYCLIGGYRCGIEITAPDPQSALDTVEELLKEVESKVAQIRVSDAASGQFIRGYS